MNVSNAEVLHVFFLHLDNFEIRNKYSVYLCDYLMKFSKIHYLTSDLCYVIHPTEIGLFTFS